MWTYGIELLGCAAQSNIAVIQRYQSNLLRSITNAPWHVSNHTLHFYLHIPYVHTVFWERTATHRTAPGSHPNPLMEPLVHPPNTRCLKRRWTFDELLLCPCRNLGVVWEIWQPLEARWSLTRPCSLVSSPFFCLRGLGGEIRKLLWQLACLRSGPGEFLRVSDVSKTYQRIPRSRDTQSAGA